MENIEIFYNVFNRQNIKQKLIDLHIIEDDEIKIKPLPKKKNKIKTEKAKLKNFI